MAVTTKVNLKSDNPVVQKILSGTANTNIRLMAAKGVLPVSTFELLHILLILATDQDPAVVKATQETAWSLDEATAVPVLSDLDCDPQILDAFARIALDKENLLRSVIQNRTTLPKTLAFLGAKVNPALLEIMVTNQIRLIKNPEIMDAILTNPALTPDIRRRVNETRDEFITKREAEDERIQREEIERVRQEALDEKTRAEEAEAAAAEAAAREAAGPQEEEKRKGAVAEVMTQQKLLELSVPEKIEKALKGTKSERTVLIRDGSKVVREAVMQSPKLGDAEIESYAAMRNMPEEILRNIGNSREWTKNYSVVLNLVRNPKCPIPISMTLLKRLNPRDMKILSTDKNIPEVIRRQAKQAMERSGGGKRKGG